MFFAGIRKRYVIRAMLLGAVLTAVIGAAAGAAVWKFGPGAVRGKQAEEGKETVEAFRLREELGAGSVIKETDLEAVMVPMELLADYDMKKEELVGQALKLGLSKGTILNHDFVYEGEVFSEDMRIHNYSYIKMTDRLKKGDYVDIRISFPNGTDFIVLSRKKVMELTRAHDSAVQEDGSNALWLEVGEEEILRLSSAVVDAALREGSSLYAIQYASDTQKEAVVTYPVNKAVALLMEKDPNIWKRAEAVVEERLRDALDAELPGCDDRGTGGEDISYGPYIEGDKVTDNNIVSGNVYEPGEDIVYLD